MLITSGYGNNSNSIQLWNQNRSVLWQDALSSPSFVIADGKHLFVALESDKNATICSYLYSDSQYILIDQKTCNQTNLCHLCYSKKHHMLFGSCWGSGHLLVLNVEEDGTLSPIRSHYQDANNSEKQSRVHCSVLNNQEDLLITSNIGLDCLVLYSIHNQSITEKERIPFPDGSGPRHMVLSKNNCFLYVCTENSNEVFVIDINNYQFIQQIPTTVAANSNCSAICLSENEKHLYVANRFSDTIAHFQLKDYMIEQACLIPCNGKNPRHMILSSNHELIVAYQDSNFVSIAPLDENHHPDFQKDFQIPQQNAAGLCENIF